MSQNKYILLSPYIVAHDNPRAERYTSIQKRISELDYDTITIHSSEADILDAIKVGRAKLKDYLPKKEFNGSSKQSNKLIWPDLSIHLIIPYVWNCLRSIKQDAQTYVICFVHPISIAVAALIIKKLRPRITCIIDMGDTFYNNTSLYNQHGWFKYLSYFLEKKIIQNADLIVVNNDAIKEELKRRYSPQAKISVLPAQHDIALPTFQHAKGLRLYHLGNLYPGEREAQRELDILHKIFSTAENTISFELHLYGNVSISNADLQKPWIFIHERKAIHTVIEEIKVPAILISFSNATPYLKQSKIELYKTLELPILYFYSHPEDIGKQDLEHNALAVCININLSDADLQCKKAIQHFLSLSLNP